MAFLVVRIPSRTSRAAVLAEARRTLASAALDDDALDALAAATSALGEDAVRDR
jgi:hypothetical protein